MSITLILWWAAAAAVTLAVLLALIKGGKPVRGLLSSAAGGLFSLLAVDIAGVFTGVTLGVNPLTLGAGTVLGAPGVITLLVLKAVLG